MLKDIRPYILWAHIQWLDESDAKPHIVIQNGPKTLFPPAFQSHSVVIFNVSTESVKGMNLDENGLSFSAKFGGKEFRVYAPLDCLMQIHSADGTVRVGLQPPLVKDPSPPSNPGEKRVQEILEMLGVEPKSISGTIPEIPAIPEIPTGPKFTSMGCHVKPKLVTSSGTSDGIKRGKLSLVSSIVKKEEE